MRLSYSSISTYQNCPLAYKFRYIDRLPTKRTPYLSFGTSLHAILAYFYEASSVKPPSLDRLLEYLPQVWESEGYSDSSEEQTFFEQAKKVLSQFYHTNIIDLEIPVALEHRFAIELDCCTLTGIIDRVDKLPNGGYEVIDYKTSRKLPPKARIHTDLQLSIYHLACQELWGSELIRLSLYYLMPNTKRSTKRSKSDIDRTKSLIARVCKDIEDEKYEPKENPLCPWCDFQNHCPIREQTSTPARTSGSTQNSYSIEDRVAEFFSVKQKLKDYQTRLHLLEQDIHFYCHEQKKNSLSFQEGEILRRKSVIQSFNVDKLREILEPQGLWEEVVGVDSERLRRLIKSKDLDENLKEEIRAAIENEEISYNLYAKE